MSKWKWAAGAIGVIALGAFAAAWALTEADVLRWGATAALHDRIEALERRAEAAPKTPDWTVLSREGPVFRVVGGAPIVEACITYTSPSGVQERCRLMATRGPGGEAEMIEDVGPCWDLARIGAPLPDCWR